MSGRNLKTAFRFSIFFLAYVIITAFFIINFSFPLSAAIHSVSQDSVIENVTFNYPIPDHPFYHIKLFLNPKEKKPFRIKAIFVNNTEIRDFKVYNNTIYSRDNLITDTLPCFAIVRCDWVSAESYAVSILGSWQGSEQIEALSVSTNAPQSGGYWNTDWKYYASLVISENHGLDRSNEPIHSTLSLYRDRVINPEKEIRVVAVDPGNYHLTEIPSQVYDIVSWREYKNEQLQPSTSFSLSFLADVQALTKKVYLIFYGNTNASFPDYKTDLTYTGEGPGLLIENSAAQFILSPQSGALKQMNVKMGIHQVYENTYGIGYSLYPGPACSIPRRPGVLAADWNPPENFTQIAGPVFIMTRRWGYLPGYQEAYASITYLFYANNPYHILMSSLEMREDSYIRGIHNGGVILNNNLFSEFAWKNLKGDISTIKLNEVPQLPKHALELEPDTPWLAFVNREKEYGFGGITIETNTLKPTGSMARYETPVINLNVGPFLNWYRGVADPAGTINPQRVTFIQKGTIFYEKNAYMPFHLEKNNSFVQLNDYRQRLINPLSVSIVMDTDLRVPKK